MLVRKFSHSVVLLFLSLFMLYRLQSLTDPLLILLAVLKIWCDQLLAKLPTTAKNHVKDKTSFNLRFLCSLRVWIGLEIPRYRSQEITTTVYNKDNFIDMVVIVMYSLSFGFSLRSSERTVGDNQPIPTTTSETDKFRRRNYCMNETALS